MKKLALAAASVFLLASAANAAGPDRVLYPKGFETDFLLYNQVDRPDRKRIRFMYVNKNAASQTKPGADAPDGTVLVMEDHEAELDTAGNPLLDPDGRMKASAKVSGVFVMEKRAGWGLDIPESRRNSDWDYASFQPTGVVNATANLEPCFTCHLARKSRDFTFTFFKNAADGLPR